MTDTRKYIFTVYMIFASFVKHGKKYKPIWHITIIIFFNEYGVLTK